MLETLKSKKKSKKKNGDGSDWTWREFSDLVKFTKVFTFGYILFVLSWNINFNFN
jgi:hypothetical protein